ncbi:MAG: ester cyclase [Myxococcales bacterium]|nr:ester cyclase [Myxococcales bacterium]
MEQRQPEPLRDVLASFYDRVWATSDQDAISAAIDELVSPDCLVVGLPAGRDIARTGFKQFRAAFLGAFESARITIDDCIEDGDRRAVRATATLHRGGVAFTMTGGGFATVRDGQLVEAYNQWDFLTLATALGHVPPGALLASLADPRPVAVA